MSRPLRIVIVGGVAAGPKVASKIIRLCQDAEVTIVEKGRLLSYAGCGLPYYVSGVVKGQKELMCTPVGTVRDPVSSNMSRTSESSTKRRPLRLTVRAGAFECVTWCAGRSHGWTTTSWFWQPGQDRLFRLFLERIWTMCSPFRVCMTPRVSGLH